mgnify:CR=1 FL=1
MAAISHNNDLVSRLKADEPNPALLEHARKRAESVQNRIADRITDLRRLDGVRLSSTSSGSAAGSASASRSTRTAC